MPCGNHDTNKKCNVEGCGKIGKGKGYCPKCGLFRRVNKCNRHETHAHRSQYTKFRKDKCEKCGGSSELTVHHIDSNPKNNDQKNLMTLCRKCHDRVHGFIPRKTRAKPRRDLFSLVRTLPPNPPLEIKKSKFQ